MASLISDLLDRLHKEYVENRSGTPLQGVPSLEGIDEDAFGICIAMADGQIYESGDTDVEFCIQSISKAFTYGLALCDQGKERVDATIDMEPSGDAFNEISLHPVTGRPRNPMINAGAIAASSLVAGQSTAEQTERIHSLYETYAGRELGFAADVFADEMRDGNRNRAISYMLAENDKLRTEPDDAVEVYLRQCSVLVTCRDLAMMGATLANNGINPVTEKRAIDVGLAERVLSVMSTCGMYDAAGEWVAEVGMAAKSGVGGGILAVLPGQLAIAVFSPRLDEHGNSVRGVAACRRLSKDLELHALHVTRGARGAVRTSYDLLEAPSALQRPEADRLVLEEHGHRARIYELQGDLLFSGAESVTRQMCADGRDLEYAVIDVRSIDDVADVAARLLVGVRTMLREWGCEPVLIDHADRSLPEPPEAAAEERAQVFTTRAAALEWIEEQLLARYGEERAPEADIDFRSHPLFSDVDASFVDALESRMQTLEFADGETIVQQGDEDAGVFIILSGRVRQSLKRAGGSERAIATLTPGTCFGDVYLATGTPHPMTVRAEGDVRLLTLTREKFDEVRAEDVELYATLLGVFMHAIREEQGRMLAVIAGTRTSDLQSASAL
ncbi:glutaminase A [Epidermidibacterium keratini]|uniref:Glutaminase n=1 Tax=Epidermidibacterium keratini TaxID=1891644 RepID=A0A7L4YM39_9ACTN|nr:glutaminase A [Epidermidibacterium keratini]QHC00236.1 glutaminase A [Epidermidibacterium keratini]